MIRKLLNRGFGSLLSRLRKKPVEQESPPVLVDKSPEKSGPYNTPEIWNLRGPRPSDEVIDKLLSGLRGQGEGHLEYVNENGNVVGIVRLGIHSWYVKDLIWWINGGKQLGKGRFGIASNCSFQKCANPAHMRLQEFQQKQDKPEPVKVEKEKTPPPEEDNTEKWNMLKGDGPRTNCISSKAWFSTEALVIKTVKVYNKELRRKGQNRLIEYDCPWCAGWHMTSHKTSKRKYKPVGSWK